MVLDYDFFAKIYQFRVGFGKLYRRAQEARKKPTDHCWAYLIDLSSKVTNPLLVVVVG